MVNLEELYKERGFAAKPKTAGEIGGPCPFCGGKDRFVIFTRQGRDGLGRFWCRQCGKSGDAIQFLRDLEGMSFQEAKRQLGLPEAERLPRRIHTAPKPQKPDFSPGKAAMPGQEWQKIAGRLVEWAAGQLEREPQALEWLEKARGLSLGTVRAARLGWIPQDYYRPREKFGLAPELKPNGKPRRVWIPKGLVIPVFSADGQLMRVKFRVFGAGETRPKYIPLPQAEKNTAPLVLQGKAEGWQIVESELDGLLMHQEAGQIVNVAALGSAVFRPDADTWAKLSAAGKILVSLDFDEAGNKAACQWWKSNLKPGQCRLWPVPEGKDPTDAFRAGWNLAAWARAGLNF